MVHLDFSQETLKTYIKKILRASTWHELSKYYKQNLRPVTDVDIQGVKMTLCVHNEGWYLKHDVFGVLLVPGFMGQSLANENRVTAWFGPYVFINGFEKTTHGIYLMEMLEYYHHMSPRAQEKVDGIISKYGFWVQQDPDFIKIMEKWKYDFIRIRNSK